MNIVFNVNLLGLEGLGATLTSLIRNCSNPNELIIWFLCSDLKKKDKNNINKLLNSEKFNGEIKYIDFDAYNIFGHLNSLYGDWTTYGRLIISDYISEDEVLYLDADLIISLDILTLKNFNFSGNILAAVHASEVVWALDGSFLINKLKWQPETSYFNAGIIYFNLKKWRELNINAKWEQISKTYPNELVSHDQTLLNIICEGKYVQLPIIYNNPWYSTIKEPPMSFESILHFVGSPKPWDIFGNLLHPGYKTWAAYNVKLWKNQYSRVTLKKVKRIWKIKNSIIRQIIKK